MDEPICVNCGTSPMNNPDEFNVCMLCGGTLCERCYDTSPYCKACERGNEQDVRSGECIECGRSVSRLSANGYCEGCVMQAVIDAMEPEERWK